MTGAAAVLCDMIRREGPIPFRRFMDTALYHPETGYYRRPHDPFGVRGDFFTAEQVQPSFGILMRQTVRRLYRRMGSPPDFTVVELGAGREEMADAFREWRYIPLDLDRGKLPNHFRGVVFSNEFFDALPVDVAVYRDGTFHERLVAFDDGRFAWRDGSPVSGELREYFRAFFPPPEEGFVYEARPAAEQWMQEIAAALDAGFVLTIDYGYAGREWLRFPQGTLMGYRRHSARDAVLEAPGERDITAHVNFTALQAHGEAAGLRAANLQTLARTLLDAGQDDDFACVLEVEGEAAQLHRRMQLKTLLFGMGETFRTLLQEKNVA